jgi:hypothetical protein
MARERKGGNSDAGAWRRERMTVGRAWWRAPRRCGHTGACCGGTYANVW